MDTELLLKYVKGTSLPHESEKVMEWARESEENRKYLIELTNMYAMLPQYDDKLENTLQYDAFVRRNVGSKGVGKIGFVKRYFPYAALFALLVSVTFNIIQSYKLSHRTQCEAQPLICGTRVVDSLKRVIYVAKGEKSRVELPDGSVVWLNSDSEITFPLKFSTKAREVLLSGEAYFDVVENPNHPMIVKLGNDYSLKVLGTTFNVKSYKGENTIETTLYTGKIDIYQEGKDEPIHKMRPNETYVIKPMACIPASSIINPGNETMGKIAAWKDGILYFENSSLEDVIIRLERWYGVDVEVCDKQLLEYKFTGKFDNEPAVNILYALTQNLPVEYTIQDNIIYIESRK